MRTVAFLFFLWVSSLNGQDTDVLFMGNSYTYFWNLPQVVKAMANDQQVSLDTRQSTAGGANLGQHWRNEKELQSHDAVANGAWDYVVLQDHSLRAIQYPDSLDYYMGEWVNEIRSNNAEPLLYMTWARSFDPTMIDLIAPEYEGLAAKYDIGIVPVGRIWQLAQQLRPDIELYDQDKSHPSPLGTYLTACAFYSVITGKESKGISPRLNSVDQDGEKLYIMIVSPQDAQFCQSVVDKFLSTYGKD